MTADRARPPPRHHRPACSTSALEAFFGLRATPRLRKKPSTSELIDWICALKKAGVDLAKVGDGIPFLGTLLKTEQRRRARREAGEGVERPMFVDFLFELRRAQGAGVDARVDGADGGAGARPARVVARRLLPAVPHAVREGHRALRRLRRGVPRVFKDVHTRRARAHRGAARVARRPAGARRADRRAARRRCRRSTSTKLRELFEQRLQEQKERHDGGNRWIGTGGTSPFGTGGRTRRGMRVGGGRRPQRDGRSPTSGASRSTAATSCSTSARSTSRCAGCAGSAARARPRSSTSTRRSTRPRKNAGELEVVFRPPRRNRVRSCC